MKKSMKALLAMVLTLAMVLSLAACGGGSDSGSGSSGGSGDSSSANSGDSGSSGGAAEGEPMTIKIATVHNDGSVGVRCLEAFKEYLETETNGRITVEIYAGGVLGDWTTALEMLYENDIQIDVLNPVSFETQVPELALLNNYYTFDSLDHLHKFFEGEGGDFIMNSWNKIGIQGLALLSLGFRELYNSARPINSMDDLKGLKIRGYSTVQIAAWQAVGVDAVSIDWNELFVSLQQKLIDGEEGATVNFEDYSFYEVQKYFTMTDHVMGCDMAVCNQEWYEGLNDTDRALIDEASKVLYEYHRDHYIAENEDLLKKFADEYGIEVAELDPAVKAEMAEKMGAVTKAEIVKITGEDVFNQYMELVDAAR
ncbi:MAG: TRAP transporter substrate-binding protein [Oscillibacter sp.]|nr:TRAP transporter substrate-binding protein [Oscillibacter sp.]